MKDLQDSRIGVIGLGYVGLPLAVEFSKKLPTIGFDIKTSRVSELSLGVDTTREVSSEELQQAERLAFTSDPEQLRDCNIHIVAVPTPIDEHKRPDLGPLCGASEIVGSILKEGDVVIFESTVYPGASEEVCLPILEKVSGLACNRDFFIGYSPERINPGDARHRLPDIVKVTSGSTPEAAEFVDNLYKLIITAGTFKASSIKVAEAAKVIENTQRDVNIALVNELALIFNLLDINTMEVLQAAGTKWNFLPFQPGLVGGHCIGVDPYYLTHKAQQAGYHPEMILAGRRLNDNMGNYIASQVVKLMLKKRIHIAGAAILVMGLTFKENCPDLRNTGVAQIIKELATYGADVEVYDPWVNPEEAQSVYSVRMVEQPPAGKYDAVIVAVAHREFIRMDPSELQSFCKGNRVIYDVKHILEDGLADASL